MFRLASIIYALAGPTLAGIFVVVALVLNRVDLNSILMAAGAGALLGVPTAWIIAKKILSA